ncbi:hypothetical protein FJQ87_08655 [Shewanella sp. SNU WT4]|uniref:hypothetical protein n=1 Tax=Shewanella sp. SNU WT4 TaxID=2590015 RepID=UPI0011292F0C|nr:hypothetical protein [Shewanella sp. SNU WT4]QDF66772.1 hypothetical protein FJQ87_08655 [Shewanella sp. SNU WT4]
MWWRIILMTLAYILLGAHFLRYNQVILAGTYTLLPLLIFIQYPLVMRALQLCLVISTCLVWGGSTYEYVQTRILMNAPWLRLMVIMLTVTAFSLFAAYCGNGILKRRQLNNQLK